MTPSPIVELSGVSRTFGVDPPVHAVKTIDLTIQEGEWLTIVGPSGSGKSTLLNIVGLLDRPTAGSYHMAGIEVTDLSERFRAGIRAREIGFVFQAFHLMEHRSVLENVMLADLYRKGDGSTRRARAEAALERVRLGHRLGFVPPRLSGGERQRVAIARAVLGEPRLLLCDEPTGNLDSATGSAILEVFDEMHADGLTVVVITHDQDVAVRSERQMRMMDGVATEVV